MHACIRAYMYTRNVHLRISSFHTQPLACTYATRKCMQPAIELQTKSVIYLNKICHKTARTHLGLPVRRESPALNPSRALESLQYPPISPLSELLSFPEEEEEEEEFEEVEFW